MLHQLQLDPCDPPLFSVRELATDAQALIRTLEDINVATTLSHSHALNEKEAVKVSY